MKKSKNEWLSFIGLLVLALSLACPSVVNAADSAHYELKGWTAGVAGDSAGVTFGYIGADGTPLTGRLPLDRSMFNGHENDPSWTGRNSAAPILAYINKHGIDNNIQDAMNPSYFDPTILKALAGQGISVQQLGGPANPQAGKANYSSDAEKKMVGIGIPASSSSSASDSSSSSSSNSSSQASSPTPPAQAKISQSQQSSSSDAKVGTNLNPVPDATKTPAEIQADPNRENPPAFAINDTTPTKLTDNTQQKKSKLPIILGIVAGVLVLGGVGFGIWKYKQKKILQ